MTYIRIAGLASVLVLTLAAQACSPTTRTADVAPPVAATVSAPVPPPEDSYAAAWDVESWDPNIIYGEKVDGNFTLPRIDAARINPRNVRQVVDYKTNEPPGTIVVSTSQHFLYFVLPEGRAVRYGIGVGSAGLSFEGEAIVQHKQQWPRWIPTPDMIKRKPAQYAKYADGVDGGLGNPMGARALYMFQNGIDTYYRIHGTNDPSSIGRSVSAGCIRMFNQDTIDLYQRVRPGTRVIVEGVGKASSGKASSGKAGGKTSGKESVKPAAAQASG